MTNLPFGVQDVEVHDRMILRVPGKVADTVLTVERMIYTTRICEYDGPLGYGRFWCYESDAAALEAIFVYLKRDAASEPDGWQRAVDHGPDGYRVRRAHTSDGKRVVTEGGDL